MSLISRPPQITDIHLRRRALVYIRQSSEHQVQHSVGSTALQRDLKQVVEGWGWPLDAIDIIDDDLGVSGAHAGLRSGFNALIQRIERSEVGIVAVVDSSRLARNPLDSARFFDAARRHDVLFFHGGQVADLKDPNAEFTSFILAANATRENRARAEYSRAARRRKAEAGIATTAFPVGYLAERGGVWHKDSDPRVREVIQLVFDKFTELGSCGAVFRFFKEQGLQLPRRRRLGRIDWDAPSRVRIHRILRNPAYAGIYVYGATQSRDGRQIKVPRSEWLQREAHHEPYVARQRWDEIQQRLSNNRRSVRPPIGRGDSLLQGLLRCTCHGRRFHTFYSTREKKDGKVVRRPFYRCSSGNEAGTPFCGAVRASTLDHAVERELFRVLELPASHVIQDLHRQAQQEHEALSRLRQAKERAAEQQAAEAERAFHQADSTHSLVKRELSMRWEEALRRLDDVRAEHARNPLVPPQGLSDNDETELRRLLADLPAVWRHPRVTPQQRKAVARAAIETIHVTPGRESWHLDIEWDGGNRTKLEFLTAKGVFALVNKAAQDGQSAAEIAKVLGDRGAIQRSGPHIGKPYTTKSVKLLIRKSGWERVFKREAYAYIRTRYTDGARLREIAQELNERGLPHPRGRWTEHRVQGTVYRLRVRPVAEIAPPPDIGRLGDRVMALHNAGRSPSEIADQLRRERTLTMQRRPPTPDTVRQILRRRAQSLATARAHNPRRSVRESALTEARDGAPQPEFRSNRSPSRRRSRKIR